MLINNERALAYTTRISDIHPIDGADNIELATVNGWNVIVKIGEFNVGDQCVFFEIDSKLPEKPWSEFLASKHYKIKTMKLGKFGVISQGLALPVDVFGVEIPVEDNVDVTKLLGVTYSVEEDNVRKASSPFASRQSFSKRYPNVANRIPFRWILRTKVGRNFLNLFVGKSKRGKGFPKQFPFVKVTDEERCENLPWILSNKEPWVKTQKIDGTSSTYILEKKRRKYEKYVCSRNVRQLNPSQKNYHKDIDGNVYWMMADKYAIFDFLKDYLEENKLDYVCLQGEIAGESVQGNPHKLKGQNFFGYNLIRSDIGRLDSVTAKNICDKYGIPWVPIADTNYIMPDTMEELKLDADGLCIVGKGKREGWVYRSQDGERSFKNVSREYLLSKKE